jgi:glc operon protein GlcG
MSRLRAVAGITIVVLLGAGLSAQLADKKVITLDLAKQLATVGEREIARNSFQMFLAIVDESGIPIFVERVNDAQPGSYEVAIAKARTAALYRRPSKAFDDMVRGGATTLLSIPQITTVEGGVPLTFDGKVIGAVGLSGGSAVQDGAVAQAVADALAGLVKK